jgi:RNA polymerase sigma-70 factor (ECF subfamily)
VRDAVEQAMRGDREAFASLVNQTSDRMYAVATRILRDTHLAEDALQSALVTAWRQLPTLRDPDRFEAWVGKLVVHACYAEARRRSTWAANVRALPIDGPTGPDDILGVSERDALDRAFRRLSVEQRAVFVLHHHLGLPLVEIAETLGVPAGTARSRLHYATRTLRAAIEADAAPAIPHRPPGRRDDAAEAAATRARPVEVHSDDSIRPDRGRYRARRRPSWWRPACWVPRPHTYPSARRASHADAHTSHADASGSHGRTRGPPRQLALRCRRAHHLRRHHRPCAPGCPNERKRRMAAGPWGADVMQSIRFLKVLPTAP